jgi:glutamate-1-semialdehyde 2,1-aminomutase
VVALRRHGLRQSGRTVRTRFARSAALTARRRKAISDLQFTASYRVPFQFSRYVREHLKGGGFLQSSAGVKVTDLDGNELYDLTGSYGVNVFGYDFLQAAASPRAAPALQNSARCSAPITRWWPTTRAACARFPAWTKCPSTCPAPRR